MENQHRQIKGYRELSQGEIDAMNKVKELGKQVGDLIASLNGPVREPNDGSYMQADPRWLAIAKTDLQKGFMSLTRSIAKPEFF